MGHAIPGPLRDGSVNRGQMDLGSAGRGLITVGRWSTGRWLVGRGAVERGLVGRGLVKSGPLGKGSVSREPTCRGLVGPIVMMTSLFRVIISAVILIPHLLAINDAVTLAPIYWNSSNAMFKASRNDHVIQVNLYDDIDFVCPYYSSTSDVTTSSRHRDVSHDTREYYIIYQVSRNEYEQCIVYSESSTVAMLTCNHPERRKRFTILFEPFQSIPNTPEFTAGSTYYYITVSTGKRHGLNNLYHGACLHRNMKLIIYVCCTPSTQPLAFTTTTTTQMTLPMVPMTSSIESTPNTETVTVTPHRMVSVANRTHAPRRRPLATPTTTIFRYDIMDWKEQVREQSVDTGRSGAAKETGLKVTVRERHLSNHSKRPQVFAWLILFSSLFAYYTILTSTVHNSLVFSS